MLDPELKKKWVEALRSGQYKQGRKRLRSLSNEFCCLGVLCDIADDISWKIDHDGGCYVAETADIDGYMCLGYATLPMVEDVDGVRPALGLTVDEQTALWRMNDGDETVDHACSFAEIADYIEQSKDI